ncbi:glutaredoxin 3 [Hankyongella ginsenosidimutans]|uniref:Glutaredoxin n=1 Tax=Hankyongella ginsenosidimutans TaxID=1763828 RepID=A0A4D7C5W4_9SPHN|nr:glutaredoxin 3 [Hankyongella ginsenosidimutans]QCI80531.1 glutaredoxin 3 [Hankyongella ginsenosidimutans]TXG83534.1 MAG: glutaredoxin 3 [Sphingomonadales bacterium]
MAEIVIYSSDLCGYCSRAKQLLRKKGAEFQEINVTFDCKRRSEMRERAGGRTSVPQIFIDGRHIGGCDDLHALDARGELDPLLTA